MVARLSDWFGANRNRRVEIGITQRDLERSELEEAMTVSVKDGTNLSMKDVNEANLDGSGS